MSTAVAHIGRWLRERRLWLGMSQSHLARDVGVEPAAIGMWERGEGSPTGEQALRLAGALGLGAEDTNRLVAASRAAAAPPGEPGPHIVVDLARETNGNGNGNGNGKGARARLEQSIAIEIIGRSGDPWTDAPGRPMIRVVPGAGPAEPEAGEVLEQRDGFAPVAGPPAPIGVLQNGSTSLDLAPFRPSSAARFAEAERRRRQAERRERRDAERSRRAAVRDAIARRRQEAQAEYRRRQEEDRPRALVGPGGVFDLGTVFPLAERNPSAQFTYSTAEPTYQRTPTDRLVYVTRIVRLVLVFGALAALLLWAVAELGDGWGTVVDLFTGTDRTPMVDGVSGALGGLLGLLG